MDSTDGPKQALKTVAWGFLWIVGAGAIWLNLVGNPLHELRLILRAETAQGQIVNTWEDVEEGDEGGSHWYHSVDYTFRLRDGREITASTGRRSGRLSPELANLAQPIPVQVEYDRFSPSISRLKGDGNQSVGEWLVRKVGLGGVVLVLLLSPGVKLIQDGIRGYRSTNRGANGHS